MGPRARVARARLARARVARAALEPGLLPAPLLLRAAQLLALTAPSYRRKITACDEGRRETCRRPGVPLKPRRRGKEVAMRQMTQRLATLRPAIASAMVALGLAAAIGGATTARADEVWRTYEWRNGRQVLVERHYVTPPPA